MTPSDPSSQDRRTRREEALDWWARLDDGRLTRADRKAFKAWLAADPANAAALEETRSLWRELDALTPPVPTKIRAARALRRGLPIAAPALAIALAAFFAFDDLAIVWRADFTAGTEVRLIALEDGSRIYLNAGAALAKTFSGSQRRLGLLRGEAWFDVAPDQGRPFTVEAGGGTVTALGTAFDLSTGRARTDVAVTDHLVAVEAGGARAIVLAGQQTAFGPKLPLQAPRAANTEDAVAWRRGKLIFQDKPLEEVIAILGRYHRGYCLITDPGIRQRLVTGVFHTADPLEAIAAIRLSLGLRATYLTNYLILLRGPA